MIVQLPAPSAVVVPTGPLTLLLKVTVALASAVPVNVGVVSFVRLSELELPESVPGVISGVEGAGVLVSIVIPNADEDADVLPAVSVAVAVIV